MSSPYRIQRPGTGEVRAAAAAASPQDDFKLYLDRLMKMIPAEVVSLYLIGSGFIPAGKDGVLVVWAIVCLGAVLALRAYGTADLQAGQKPDWVHAVISMVAFAIWVYTLGGPFEAANIHEPYIGSLMTLAWTFFAPIFYKGPAA